MATSEQNLLILIFTLCDLYVKKLFDLMVQQINRIFEVRSLKRIPQNSQTIINNLIKKGLYSVSSDTLEIFF